MADANAGAVSLLKVLIALISLGVTITLIVNRWPQQPTPIDEPDYAALLAGSQTATEIEPPSLPFSDQTAASGIDFVHVNGANGQKLLPETMGGGGAFFDFDQDGDADILCVSSTMLYSSTELGSADVSATSATAALYENDGRGRFSNITAGSGLDVPNIYGNAVACGDYDNDGLVDIYLTALGTNHLYRNMGGGKFQDVSQQTETAGSSSAWSTSAGWFDYDVDGDLDLFVCQYLTWNSELDRSMDFTLTGSVRGYGRPTDFSGAHPVLFRNDGDGTFTDISAECGLRLTTPETNEPRSKSLGLTFAYVDDDDRLDVIIANDTVPNQVFLNRDDGTFDEVGTICGIAFDNDGSTRGAMGIAAARYRNSDALGVAIGNYANEMTALYVNQMPDTETPLFRDEAVSCGVGPVTRSALTFGMLFSDVDLDGRPDIVASNGHLDPDIHLTQENQTYAQPAQLLWNRGPGHPPEFVLAGEESTGADFAQPMVGRGLSQADIDNDGDPDLLFFALNGEPRLLRNEQNTGHHWLQLKLVGEICNLDAIGTRAILMRDDGTVMQRTVMPTGSYQSQSTLKLSFGLKHSVRVRMLKIIWPDGTDQTVNVDSVDQCIFVQQASAD